MKKIIIMLACLLTVNFNKLKAQVADTLVYLQQIVINKNNYINKPFSDLEKDLKIKIKYFSPFAGITHDLTKETSTFFGFIYPITQTTASFPGLLISWKSPYIDHKKAINFFQQINGKGWTSETDSFYCPGIITDITILPK